MKKSKLFSGASLFLLIAFCLQACGQEHKELKPYYTGEIHEQDLAKSDYTKRWFNLGEKRYTPEEKAMKTIKNNINDYKIVAFMGTWCPDSHRDIPKFFDILDEAGFDKDDLEIYTLTNTMVSQDHDEKGYNVTNIPTFIFMKDGKEANRFVEHARESVAKDIAKIVSGKPYKDYYSK